MMEKSILDGNIKTYASKKGRTSNYRLSCIDFKQEAVFDKLLEDEVNKKPLSCKKSYAEKDIVRGKKICTSTKILRRIENHASATRKSSFLSHIKKNDRKVRTKNLQRNKENSKYCSLLYKSNSSDFDGEVIGLSVYDVSPKLNPLDDYKKRQALRKAKSKPKSRLSSIAKDINTNTCLSENESVLSKVPDTKVNQSNSSVDKLDPTPAKSDERVFKKPIGFVERSSDLFYKNSINKNRGQTKTRKKLSFISNTLGNEYNTNCPFKNITGLCRTVQSDVDELFNSDSEHQNENRCSVIFDPGTASTPNFDRKKTNFESYEANNIEKEDSLEQLENTFSFFHLFTDHEQSGAIKNQFSEPLPVIKNEALDESICVAMNEPQETVASEASNGNFHVTPNERWKISKDELEKSAEHLTYSSDFRAVSSSGSHSSSLTQSEALSDSSTGFSSDSNSSSSTSNNDTFDEQFKVEIIPENNNQIELRHEDSHSSLFTFPGDSKPLENFNEISFNSDIYKQQESDNSTRNNSKNETLSSYNECQHSLDSQISSSSSSVSEDDSPSSFEEYQHPSRDQTSFSSSPISINRIFEEKYGMTDVEDQQNNSKTEPRYVTTTEPDFEDHSPLSKTTEKVVNNFLSLSITSEPEVKESSLTETTEHSSPVHPLIEPEVGEFSLIETIEFLSPIRASTEPKVEKSLHLSPIRAPIESEVDESLLKETAECFSPTQALAKNASVIERFVGWLSEEYYQAVKLKETLESICKELEPKYTQPEDEIPAHLKLVTRRRKKTFIMPTLNEENSDLEENEEVDLCSKTRNSPVHSQDLQLGSHNQTSLCTSRFLERSSLLGHSMVLATGKKWRRSFITLKNILEYGFQSQTEHKDLKGRCWRKNVEELISNQLEENTDLKEIAEISTRTYSNETFLNPNYTYLERCKRPSKARFSLCVSHKSPSPQQQQRTSESSGLTSSSDSSKLLGDKSYFSFVGSEQDSRIENNYDLEAGDYSRSHKVSLECHDIRDHLSAKETVLRYCKQTKPLPFEECFNDRLLKNCKKIGEGVYGEVFMLKRNQAHCSVLKIIPIEGDLLINGEKQKKYEEIVSELVISKELSDLRKRKDYFTDNFAELQRCWCVYGKYPNRLIDLWDTYNDKKGSDNDSPKVFDENQLYIILELSHGGEDIESFVFNNAQQALSVFTQVAYALAVAEQAFNFEHRDLHWGNILVSKSKKERTKYIIGDFESTVRLRGVQVTIIDYTLSRITVNDGIVFNDIGQDPELFTAQGDFQFEVYRLMKNEVRDIWSEFKPKTNVYWLCYLLDKMIKEVRYRRVSTQIHRNNLNRLNEFFELILGFASSHELVCDSYFKRTISATK